MDAIARAWKKAVRTALPGPWRPRRVVGEAALALLMGGFAALLELAGSTGLAVPFGIGVALLWVLRRGLPATVLLAAAAATGWSGGPVLLLICAGWTAGARIRRVWTLVGTFVLGWLLFTVTGVLKDATTTSPKLVLGLSLGGFLVLAVLPALYGRYRAQRRALLDALRERNDQLLRERAMVVHQARLRERHRIAQDMHDSLGHQLALISVHSGALEVDRTLTDRQREAVGVLRQAAVAAMRELREVVGVLHDESTALPPTPGAVAGGPARGGADGIEGLVESSRAAGAEVVLSREGERRPLPAAVDHAAYRIVQEALTNAHKHAPGAPIGVALRYEPDALVVEVTNARTPELVGVRAGAGPAVSGGQGLTGLRERARLVGGMVHAGPTPDQGFRLAAVLPYEAAEGAGEGAAAAAGADDWAFEGLSPSGEGEGGRRSPALGCALGVVGVGLTVLALCVWGVVAFVGGSRDATVGRPAYERIQVGAPEAEAVRELPPGNDFFVDQYKGTGPTPPEGSRCRWYLLGDQSDTGWDEDHVARFCFKDGVLVDKQEYVTKN
ncbi:sensor histidine kinase [Streptomyces sp. 1114.5]|uniref:sensor histidine kinase n=1 Tax=Streptomyces sp. 1114.5 TaxID=1938830 RepID=UPI00217D7D83|nr:histidine kinase [Streptomyces sp. 1114.5]